MTAGTFARVSIRFSPEGRYAACVSADAARLPEAIDTHYLEAWTLTEHGPHRTLRASAAGDPLRSYALPLGRDRLLHWSWHDERRLSLVGPAGVLASAPVRPLWAVVAAPSGSGPTLGLAVAAHGGTEVYVIADDLSGAGPGDAPVARTNEDLSWPAVAVAGRLVCYDRSRARPVVVDPTAGRLTPLPLPPGVDAAVPVCGAGEAVLLGCRREGRRELAVAFVARPGALDLVTGLNGLTGAVRPLAITPDGNLLALRVTRGARSWLLVHDRDTGTTRTIRSRAGMPELSAAWLDGGLWLAYTPSDAPTGLWWLPASDANLRSATGVGAGIPGRVESFPGPSGPVEAVVYGDWRTASRLVVALHGGPAERWTLRFEPKLQALAAGAAVIAPNPRGSTGYGRTFQEAIKGAWGGPDLADILAIGAHVTDARAGIHGAAAAPGIYGVSYGAFLGLLAMAAAPRLWSGVVAVAPFLSGARLRPAAPAPVRALIDRLDGTAQVGDSLGPRDLILAAPRIRGRVLLVHGEQDDRIPVSHSRMLAAALADRPGVQLTYRELPGRGHDPVPPDPDAPELVEIVRFLVAVPPGAGPAGRDSWPAARPGTPGADSYA